MRGSPPRVRGKVKTMHRTVTGVGITPACAGKRTDELFCVRVVRDHPRVCGEKLWHPRRRKTASGSPPRVRGKGRCGRVRQPERGITPACAGKSPTAELRAGCCRDHPRVCGEKGPGSVNRPFVRGSPPRVRGKVVRLCMATGLRRITPACAGKR